MKVKLKEVELLALGLKEISALNTFEFDTSLKIAKNLDKLEVTINTINKKRQQLFDEHAKEYESEKGSKDLLIKGKENIDAYNEKLNKLLDTETELKAIQKLKVEELKKGAISGNTLRQLFIIIEDL